MKRQPLPKKAEKPRERQPLVWEKAACVVADQPHRSNFPAVGISVAFAGRNMLFNYTFGTVETREDIAGESFRSRRDVPDDCSLIYLELYKKAITECGVLKLNASKGNNPVSTKLDFGGVKTQAPKGVPVSSGELVGAGSFPAQSHKTSTGRLSSKEPNEAGRPMGEEQAAALLGISGAEVTTLQGAAG